MFWGKWGEKVTPLYWQRAINCTFSEKVLTVEPLSSARTHGVRISSFYNSDFLFCESIELVDDKVNQTVSGRELCFKGCKFCHARVKFRFDWFLNSTSRRVDAQFTAVFTEDAEKRVEIVFVIGSDFGLVAQVIHLCPDVAFQSCEKACDLFVFLLVHDNHLFRKKGQ